MSCCGEELLPFVTLWTESGLGAMGRKENSEQVAVRAGVRWLVGWRGRNLRPRFSPKILEFLPSIRFRWKKHPSKSSSNLPHTSPRYLLRHCPTPTMNHLRRVVAAPTNLACVRRSLSSAVPKTWGKPAEGPTFNSVSQSWSQSVPRTVDWRATD